MYFFAKLAKSSYYDYLKYHPKIINPLINQQAYFPLYAISFQKFQGRSQNLLQFTNSVLKPSSRNIRHNPSIFCCYRFLIRTLRFFLHLVRTKSAFWCLGNTLKVFKTSVISIPDIDLKGL